MQTMRPERWVQLTVYTCTETISELTGNIYLKLTKFQNKIALKDNNA